MIHGLPIGFEHAARVAVDKWMLAGRIRRRRQIGAVVDPAVRLLLALVVDAPHVLLQIREEARKSLLIAPDVGAGRSAAAVRAFPAVDVAICDSEDDAGVTERGYLRGDA